MVSQVERPAARGSASEQADKPLGRLGAWLVRHNTILTFAAASIAPALYLAFVSNYAVNSFNGDDWSVVLLIHPALHGQLTLSELWSQYNESRLFLGNVVDVLFGAADRFDLRSVIFFSAGLYIASFAILLGLLRRYLGRVLTPVPVVALGAIWFSVADVQNALWAFQVSWYLTVFFLLSMLFALLVPANRPSLWFGIAAFAALAASMSTIQGFLCWPLGGICILWTHPWGRRARTEIATWIGLAVLTTASYLPGYDFANNGCIPARSCTPATTLHHAPRAVGFFFALMGNVVPGGLINYYPPRTHTRFVALGVVIGAVAVFVLVQSWRRRSSEERLPLPLLLIGFALAFDVTITLGRGSSGAAGALRGNRYVMANLILVAGILIYALKHLPPLRVPAAERDAWLYARWATALVLAVFLVVQVKDATDFGLTNARLNTEVLDGSARLSINLNRVPVQARSCKLRGALSFQPGASPSFDQKLHDAAQDRLGQFEPSSYRHYRALGFGEVSPNCTKRPSSTKPSA